MDGSQRQASVAVEGVAGNSPSTVLGEGISGLSTFGGVHKGQADFRANKVDLECSAGEKVAELCPKVGREGRLGTGTKEEETERRLRLLFNGVFNSGTRREMENRVERCDDESAQSWSGFGGNYLPAMLLLPCRVTRPLPEVKGPFW